MRSQCGLIYRRGPNFEPWGNTAEPAWEHEENSAEEGKFTGKVGKEAGDNRVVARS